MSTSPTTTTNNNSNNENSKRIQSSSSSSATTTTTTTTPIDLEPVFAKVSLFARRYFKFLVEHLPRIVDLGERHSAAVNLCEVGYFLLVVPLSKLSKTPILIGII